MDLDPGGPKTYGSGSGKHCYKHKYRFSIFYFELFQAVTVVDPESEVLVALRTEDPYLPTEPVECLLQWHSKSSHQFTILTQVHGEIRKEAANKQNVL
jgi:hypothetical protein